ncbi:sigma 54-interacting transcriptional regulator [Aeoliella sp. SH292]|uniref:sigma 54-interacting transcriptional regulator n=1 Tax=Aeoliella sp. SH292 TaxID=3454464 RepID=UPI003F9A8BF1
MFDTQDLPFLEALAEMVYSNPFSRRRMELEQQALGAADSEENALVWSRTQTTEHEERATVRAVTVRADSLAEECRERLAKRRSVDARSRELYDGLVTYVLYYRHIASHTIDELYAPPRGKNGQRVWREFLADYERMFAVGSFEGHNAHAAAHLFACLCQVRRAFKHIFDCILGESAPAGRLREAVWQSIFTHDMRRYRRSLYRTMRELPTLITGPSGTGKELVARAIACSQFLDFDAEREQFVDDPAIAFTPLNLSALSPTLIESELFGHRRGAFTGAAEDRVGWLEACRPHGAVFLDEIGELDLAIQVKLLRVVQQRTYTRLGDSAERTFAGKIIAATNRDLAEEIDAGRFRHDLYYRLCADRIETPSLREQLADRPQALEGLIHFIAERVAPGEANAVAAEAQECIASNMPAGYAWPGNIRELEQCVRNILVRREYTPRSKETVQRTGWLADAEAGKLTADELLCSYATWLYAQLGTYEATATKLGLDRRTVKSKIDQKLLAAIRRGG